MKGGCHGNYKVEAETLQSRRGRGPALVAGRGAGVRWEAACGLRRGLILRLGLSFWALRHLEQSGLPCRSLHNDVLSPRSDMQKDVPWAWTVYKAASHMLPHPVM